MNNSDFYDYNSLNVDTLSKYFDIVSDSFNYERDKKKSLEERANFVLGLMGIMLVYVLKEFRLNNLFNKNIMLTFSSFLYVLSCILVYLSIFVTSFCIYKIISVRSMDNYAVSDIDNVLLEESFNKALYDNIFTFIEITNSHRVHNEDRAKYFKYSLFSIIFAFFMIIINNIVK